MDENARQILSAVERTNDKIDNLKEDIGIHGERLARIETHIESLIGDGDAGRIPKIEEQVNAMTSKVYFWSGFATAVSAAIHFLFPRH